MKVRRVVTGHSGGKSVFVSDGPAPRSRDFVSIPGQSSTLIWSTPGTPVVPHDGKDVISAASTYVPGTGETRLMVVTFAPDSVMMSKDFNPAAAGAEFMAELPDLAAKFEPDNPGIRLMSQSNEIEVWLIPVRGTNMYVPYRIVLPTPVGYGTAMVTSIHVAGARRASAEP